MTCDGGDQLTCQNINEMSHNQTALLLKPPLVTLTTLLREEHKIPSKLRELPVYAKKEYRVTDFRR